MCNTRRDNANTHTHTCTSSGVPKWTQNMTPGKHRCTISIRLHIRASCLLFLVIQNSNELAMHQNEKWKKSQAKRHTRHLKEENKSGSSSSNRSNELTAATKPPMQFHYASQEFQLRVCLFVRSLICLWHCSLSLFLSVCLFLARPTNFSLFPSTLTSFSFSFFLSPSARQKYCR